MRTFRLPILVLLAGLSTCIAGTCAATSVYVPLRHKNGHWDHFGAIWFAKKNAPEPYADIFLIPVVRAEIRDEVLYIHTAEDPRDPSFMTLAIEQSALGKFQKWPWKNPVESLKGKYLTVQGEVRRVPVVSADAAGDAAAVAQLKNVRVNYETIIRVRNRGQIIDTTQTPNSSWKPETERDRLRRVAMPTAELDSQQP